MQLGLPAEKREVDRQFHLRNYASVGYRARHLFHNAKARAAKAGVPFSLTRDWVEQQLLSGHCTVTGIPFDMASVGRGQGHSAPWAPSLDRIDPARGYTFENTRAVVWMFNAAKHVGTDADVISFAEALCKRS
jgi:hypothetical protein